MNRRDFVGTLTGAAALTAAGNCGFASSQARAIMIDGLGEVHLDYPPSLIDEMLASGMRGCVVTVGNPALQGATAYSDMKSELEGYDSHIAANPDRFLRAASVADLDRARQTGKIGLLGIFQINPYLGPKERNTLTDYVRHIEHAVRIAGADHVGIGSDREHRTIPDTPEEKQKLIDELSRLRPVNASSFRWPFFISELNGPRRMAAIRQALEKRRMPSATIDKVLGENWYRLFRETIG